MLSIQNQDPALVKRGYGIPDKINLNVRVTPNGWLVATSAELPGLVTQAKNQEELIVMINDAVLAYFDVPKKDADMIYDQLSFGK